MKNPCIDPDYITIESRPLPTGLSYTLFSAPNGDGLHFVHDPFSIVASASTKAVCGPLSHSTTFEGVTIDSDSDPMKYIDETHTYIIYSENEALIGSRAITLSAHLANYPEVKSSQTMTTTMITGS